MHRTEQINIPDQTSTIVILCLYQTSIYDRKLYETAVYVITVSVIIVLGYIDSRNPKLMNPSCGTTDGSDGKIIITPHWITIHLISTMRCNFTQLSDLTVGSVSDYTTRILCIPPNSDDIVFNFCLRKNSLFRQGSIFCFFVLK
jgi:hypothetical protein